MRGRAHPHVCGEHSSLQRKGKNLQGSSPRMRGTQSPLPRPGTCFGLIPTYAGNTGCGFHSGCLHRAHPHVCGEHAIAWIFPRVNLGSSPRMRGTHPLGSVLLSPPGLIPTYAGNTLLLPRQTRLRRAHPHVCGEHSIHQRSTINRTGSSPRMRGTPPTAYPALLIFGLIPTYAGNTLEPQKELPPAGAHPHVCGEHQQQTTCLS